MKMFADSIITNFNNKEIPQEKAPKYVQEKIEIENYIDEELEKSKSNSDSTNETESDIDNNE